mgnify:CR=1 FL=1
MVARLEAISEQRITTGKQRGFANRELAWRSSEILAVFQPQVALGRGLVRLRTMSVPIG